MDLQFCARYPFSSQARTLLEQIGKGEPSHAALEQAAGRIVSDLASSKPHIMQTESSLQSQVISFALARALLAAMGDRYVADRFARAEARHASAHLREDGPETTLQVAGELGITVAMSPLRLRFDQYLRFRPPLQEFRMVNSRLANGEVQLTENELVRLVEEAARQRIGALPPLDPTPAMTTVISSLRRQLAEVTPQPIANIPIQAGAFPPCIRSLLESADKGSHMGHYGRWALAVFMLNIGSKPVDAAKLFAKQSDYNEQYSMYQAEHAAQMKYKMPGCATIDSWGLCTAHCRTRSPLALYRRAAGAKPKRRPA